ncbi:MAG TPA: hypothetical protein VMS43_06530 [Allosphingosinicella sp.]|nr:hypothetical protein [Allosphingosinicella sp.]
MSDGPSPGAILLGIFLIMCGLGVTLLGGGCTIMWLAEITSIFSGGGAGLFFFALSLATLIAGLSTIWLGIKMFGSGDRRDGL